MPDLPVEFSVAHFRFPTGAQLCCLRPKLQIQKHCLLLSHESLQRAYHSQRYCAFYQGPKMNRLAWVVMMQTRMLQMHSSDAEWMHLWNKEQSRLMKFQSDEGGQTRHPGQVQVRYLRLRAQSNVHCRLQWKQLFALTALRQALGSMHDHDPPVPTSHDRCSQLKTLCLNPTEIMYATIHMQHRLCGRLVGHPQCDMGYSCWIACPIRVVHVHPHPKSTRYPSNQRRQYENRRMISQQRYSCQGSQK